MAFLKRTSPKFPVKAPVPDIANDYKAKSLDELMGHMLALEDNLPGSKTLLGQTASERDKLISSFNNGSSGLFATALGGVTYGTTLSNIALLQSRFPEILTEFWAQQLNAWNGYFFWITAGSSISWMWHNIGNEFTIASLRSNTDRKSVKKLLDIADKSILLQPMVSGSWKKSAAGQQNGPAVFDRYRAKTQKDLGALEQNIVHSIAETSKQMDKTSAGKRCFGLGLRALFGVAAVGGFMAAASATVGTLPFLAFGLTNPFFALASTKVLLGGGLAALLGGLWATTAVQKAEFSRTVELGNMAEQLRLDVKDYLEVLSSKVNETQLAGGPRMA